MFPVQIIDANARRAGLPYLVIGGHAINVYCEPRATLDVDFLVRKSDGPKWTSLLSSEGFKPGPDRGAFIQFSPPYGVEWRLDLMLVNDQTFEKLATGAQMVSILGVSAAVPKAEHLVALKLHALKHGHPERFEKDFGDVMGLLRNARLDPRSPLIVQLFEQFGTNELYERVLKRHDSSAS